MNTSRPAHHASPPADWDAAYSNRRAVPDVDQWMIRASETSRRFGGGYPGTAVTHVPYGSGDRETFDVFEPTTACLGTVIFVHGGYWRAGTTAEHWHFGAGPLASGWRVAFVEYPLCPAVDIAHIIDCTARGVATIAARHPGPLVLAGHSAGGHLVTSLVGEGSGLQDEVIIRIERVVSLSGLHDLRPVMRSAELNADLGLVLETATRLSPALTSPRDGRFDLVCAVGADELPEFRRQNDLLANIWNGLGVTTTRVEIEGANHFTLLDHLQHPDRYLTQLLCPMIASHDRSSEKGVPA